MKNYLIIALLCIAPLAFANDAKDVIPFEIINGHIRVKISINNSRPLNFVFDTGAAANLLDEQVAKDLGLSQSGDISIQGAAGSSQMQMTEKTDYSIGKTVFKNQVFAVMDLNHLGEEGAKIDGVLGASVLLKYVAELDYDNQEIRLHDDMEGLSTKGYEAYKYSLTPFRIPIIESTLELANGEKITGKYFVDTGAALAILFNSNLVRDYDLLNTMGDNYPMISTSLSNQDTDYVSAVPKFTLFDKSFEGFTARLSQAKQGVNSFQGYHGIIGFQLLKRFNTIFDYANERMYVKPNKAFNALFPRSYSGLAVEKRGAGYQVTRVIEGSAGAEAKIKKGDIIERLDGKSFLTSSEFKRYFQETQKTIRVALTRKGEAINVSLKPRPTIN